MKLCYSESGRPRHIFLLLPSSSYSQMTNLPRETKGNNLGTSAVDIRFLLVGRTTHFFGFFTGKQNVSETMPFGVNSHSAKFQADISNSF